MATRKNPDLVRVSVVVDAEVSETAWRRACADRGIDLTGMVVGAMVAETIKSMAYQGLAAAGFPQQQKRTA